MSWARGTAPGGPAERTNRARGGPGQTARKSQTNLPPISFPVRQLIWVVAVRRAERREGTTDDARRQSLKRRASVTAALLCFVFAFFYTAQMLRAAA